MNADTLIPLNELEAVLDAVRSGNAPVSSFMDALVAGDIFVLLDKDLGPEGKWDDSASPLVLSNHLGTPVLAVFTAPERAIPMASQFPAFGYGLIIQCAWILARVSQGIGVVINPGTLFGMEVPPSVVQGLQRELMAADQGAD